MEGETCIDKDRVFMMQENAGSNLCFILQPQKDYSNNQTGLFDKRLGQATLFVTFIVKLSNRW